MDRPPIQTRAGRLLRERRGVVGATVMFVTLWLALAIYVRATPFGFVQGILFAAPFLFVLGFILGPLITGLWRRSHRRADSASGTR